MANKQNLFIYVVFFLGFHLSVNAATLSGNITLDQQSASAIPVAIYDSSWEFISETLTDSSGNYSLNVDSGSYYIYAYNANESGYMSKYYSSYGQAYSYDLATLVNTSDSSASNINFSLTTPGVISGNVTNGATALSNQYVQVFDENSLLVSWNLTGEDGSYSLGLDPGNYTLYFYDPTGFYTSQSYSSSIAVSSNSTNNNINFSVTQANISIFPDKFSYSPTDEIKLSVGMLEATKAVDIYVVMVYPNGSIKTLQSNFSLSAENILTAAVSNFTPVNLNPGYQFLTLNASSLPSGTYGVYITLAYQGYYPGYSSNQYAANYNSFTISQ